MSTTAINVNKQSVKQLLETGKANPFVIPEYQRPYAWSVDEIQVLFDDLWDFTEKEGGSERNGTYFLGSIVSYSNENDEQEIIDGQQRITSLFLLLRAIYTKLENSKTESKQKTNFMSQIAPALWRTNKLTGEVDYSNILLESKVVNNEGNEILKNILKSGIADPKAKDNYSKNYIKLQALFDEQIQGDILGDGIYNFIYAILNQAILLPITAENQDTALTIFSTLNNRGLPLSDADIFKAKIYNNLNKEEKKEFIEAWKNLDEEAENIDESMQQLFYYYMFYLRAQEGNIDTTIHGVRKYYQENKCERLHKKDLMDNLTIILDLWKVIKNHITFNDQPWTSNLDILKALDILSSFPNEFWKYPVIIYYLKYYKTETFEQDFLLFLREFTAKMFTVYLEFPTVSAVKGDVIKLNVELLKTNKPTFEFKKYVTENLGEKIKTPHPKAVRMLLKILAYSNEDQKDLLPEKWEIEHIFPQKWNTSYFPKEVSEDYVKERIEHIGNKLPFEKKLNIKASNNYFDEKKKEYCKSKICITNDMSNFGHEWAIDDINERDTRVVDSIINKFKQWDNDYNNLPTKQSEVTPEELAMIENFRQRGLVK